MEWTDSETRHHLMQAFFMESQAHSRYAFAALQAEQGGLEVVRRSFAAAAAQEEVHARAFYRLLAPCAGQILPLEGCCAVSGGGGISAMRREAGQSEREEFQRPYTRWAEAARREGCPEAGALFAAVAGAEGLHGETFDRLAQALEDGCLFVAEEPVEWVCLECGHVLWSRGAPARCPVCSRPQGYFCRREHGPSAVDGQHIQKTDTEQECYALK